MTAINRVTFEQARSNVIAYFNDCDWNVTGSDKQANEAHRVNTTEELKGAEDMEELIDVLHIGAGQLGSREAAMQVVIDALADYNQSGSY